jgi:predicted SAM-dependent methyltransferase
MGRIFFLFNNLILRIKRGRTVQLKGLSKINIGCGMTVQCGWCNVDGSLNSLVSKFPKFAIKIIYNLTGARKTFSVDEYVNILYNNDFVHHDLRYGLPFTKESASHIYTSHFLEHLLPEQAKLLLRSSYNSLQPGGVMRISVPDLEYAIGLYPEDKSSMLDKYFFINDITNSFSNHKYMYDFESMSKLLHEVGFNKVERGEYAKGDFPDVQLLDNRMKDSLIVQAVK